MLAEQLASLSLFLGAIGATIVALLKAPSVVFRYHRENVGRHFRLWEANIVMSFPRRTPGVRRASDEQLEVCFYLWLNRRKI